MTYDKAIDIFSLHIQNLQGNLDSSPSVKTLKQALQAFKKFDGAVEVDTYDLDTEIMDIKTKDLITTNKLYAIKKEQD